MKNNQKKSKSKVEVVIGDKVFTECNGIRKGGICGNKYCEAFNKPCIGIKTCRHIFGYYTTENGGGYWQPTKGGHDWNRAVAVVEPSGGAVGMTDQDVAAGITRQLQVIEDAEKNAQLERVKLGVVLIRWEQYLGDGRGRGAGVGLKGWLEKNVPALGYNAALSYKDQAKKAVEMLGGGAKAQAVLLDEPTVTQPDGEVIEIEADYVAKRDKIFEDVKSRRQLEQTYFKFMASEGKGKVGRPKGTGKPAPESYAAVHKTAAENAATAYAIVWGELDKKRQLPNLASLLKVEDARDILALVEPVYHALKKRVGEEER